LDALLEKGRNATATLWPAITQAYGWVHQAAELVANAAGRSSLQVRHALRSLLYALRQAQAELGPLAGAVTHCRAVSFSHGPYLFPCDETPDVPRSNNAVEQCFASARYHARRASGRLSGAPF